VSAPSQPTIPPHSDVIVAAFIAQLQQQLDTQAEQLDAQASQMQSTAGELQYAQLKIQVLEQRLRRALIAKYGKHREKLSDLQLELLELEPGVSSEEVQAESEREPLATPPATPDNKTDRKPAREHPGRQSLPAHLDRVEKTVACRLRDSSPDCERLARWMLLGGVQHGVICYLLSCMTAARNVLLEM